MASVETVTISGNDYSVYALTSDPVADADAYFAARLEATDWTGATADQKAQGLVTAFRMINRGPRFSGTKTVDSQEGEWPRNSATCNGAAVTDGTTPDDIANGQFELALALLSDATIQDSPGAGSNVRVAQAGSARVEFFRPTIGSIGRDTRYPQVVHEILSCYFAGSTASLGIFVDGVDASNVDERSAFDSASDDFGLSEGFA